MSSVLRNCTSLMAKMYSKVLNICPERLVAFASTYSHQAELRVIAKELEKFEGGSVDLEMDEDSGIAVMTLNNPTKLNSLTGKMMVDMAEKVSLLENWPGGKGLILRGTNGNFCSGGDLTFVRKALHYGSEMAVFQHDTLTRLLNLPLISVALIQGHTLGGGAELSTACDFRVMSSTARLGFIQMKLGLTSGWGATTRLIHLLGRQKTLEILNTANVMNAGEAETYHLVDHILQPSLSQDEEFAACKEWLLSNHCKHDADRIQSLKSSIVFCDLHRDLETSLDEERKTFCKFFGGPAQRSALAANKKHK